MLLLLRPPSCRIDAVIHSRWLEAHTPASPHRGEEPVSLREYVFVDDKIMQALPSTQVYVSRGIARCDHSRNS